MFPSIKSFCQELEQEFYLISEERKVRLNELKNYIVQTYQTDQIPQINVICTHNSRRSHIGQICLAVAADFYNLPTIQTFSGGTEATAFNIRAVKAFQRLGFDISTKDKSELNPVYEIKWASEMQVYSAFSKKYTTSPNPKKDFAAIIVCSEADETCPTIFGTDFRLSLPYDDPKMFDDTIQETQKYSERIRQIGREMLYVLSAVEKKWR